MNSQQHCTSTAPKPIRCIIIGAGIAGLTAAKTLLKHAPGRVEVCLVEAGARVGGRCCSSHDAIDGVGWEQGATWIHGIGDKSNPNPVYALALAYGLLPLEQVKGTSTSSHVTVHIPFQSHSGAFPLYCYQTGSR